MNKRKMYCVLVILIAGLIISTISNATYEYGSGYYTYPSVTVIGLDEGTAYEYVVSANSTPKPELDGSEWSLISKKDNSTGAAVLDIPKDVYTSYSDDKVYLWVKDRSDDTSYVIDGEEITLDFQIGAQIISNGGFGAVTIHTPSYGDYTNSTISYKWQKITDSDLIQKIENQNVIRLSELGTRPDIYDETVQNVESNVQADLPTTSKEGEYYILWLKAEQSGKRTILDAMVGKITNSLFSEETSPLVKIEITKKPTKTEYKVGDKFNTSGMEVTATYEDGTTKKITGYTVSPSGNLTLTDDKVIISYTQGDVTKTAMVSITVKENTENTNISEDNTTAITKLPKTGETAISLAVFIVVLSSLIGYIGYKKLNKIV